jgi:hypothetical protein
MALDTEAGLAVRPAEVDTTTQKSREVAPRVETPEQFATFLDSTLKAYPEVAIPNIEDKNNKFADGSSVFRTLTLRGPESTHSSGERDIVIMQMFNRNDAEGNYYRVLIPSTYREYYDTASEAYRRPRDPGELVHRIGAPQPQEYPFKDKDGRTYKELHPNLYLVNQTDGRTTITPEYVGPSESGSMIVDAQQISQENNLSHTVRKIEQAIVHGQPIRNPDLENQVARLHTGSEIAPAAPIKGLKRFLHRPR